MKESIILKYIWLLSGNFMIAILLAACNGSNIIPDNPDEEIEITQLYTLMYQTKYLILYYQLQGKIKPTYLRNRSVLK